jgi:UDP-N-acetyl-D-glucosamine dehydrogenase
LKVGKDFFLAYSPEREDPGSKRFSTSQIPKVVSGVTASCKKVATTLYGQVIQKVVPVSSPRVAELTKLLENIYRSVNIALVNELKMLSDRMGIDIWEVIEAASTKPFGFSPFYPGPGMGGHCIPIDPSIFPGRPGNMISQPNSSSSRRDQCLHPLLCGL